MNETKQKINEREKMQEKMKEWMNIDRFFFNGKKNQYVY